MRQQGDTANQQLCSDLETLASCCKPSSVNVTLWPSTELLESVEEGVKVLMDKERKHPVTWKTFQRLDKRRPRLRLVSRVNNLVKRAGDRFEEAGQPLLSNLKRQADRGHEAARKLLRDIAAISGGQTARTTTDWNQHERTLAQFSRTRSVEPSYGRSAPPEFRCYARALELLVDDYRRETLRRQSMPVLEWLATIGHPDAKKLLTFDYATEREIERKAKASQQENVLQQREKGRERTRRHRVWYRGKWVYPGDWLIFRDAADFRGFYGKSCGVPEVCSGLEDSHRRSELAAVLDRLSCGRKLSEEANGFFFHKTRHVARCRDCQQAEWIEDGYEIERGWPTTFAGSDDTREGRLAARKRYYREREQRWLQSPKGKQWLLETNRRFVASLKEKARQEGWTQEQLRAEAKAYGLI